MQELIKKENVARLCIKMFHQNMIWKISESQFNYADTTCAKITQEL